MNDLKTDEERAEDLKAWWKENGGAIFLGIAVAISGLFGWNYYQNHQREQTSAASSLYAQGNNGQLTPETIETLVNDYPKSPYASLAKLNEAKQAAQNGEHDTAATALSWVKDNSRDPELVSLAKLRLAKVRITQKDFDAANAILGESWPEAYQGQIDELQGDLFAAQEEWDKARESYQKALGTSAGSQFLKWKLDNLGNGA